MHRRYTFWSGLLGGLFLSLSYFGTDQSQVQRYISGASLRESRLGLMFNAVCKIPMQFFILLLGVMLFVFYEFNPPPIYFDHSAVAWKSGGTWQWSAIALASHRIRFHHCAFAKETAQEILAWLTAKHSGNIAAETTNRAAALAAHLQSEKIRAQAKNILLAANGAYHH